MLITRNNTTWVPQELIINSCGITDVTLRQNRSRYGKTVPPSLKTRDILPDTKAQWRWGKINGNYYYAMENLPLHIQGAIEPVHTLALTPALDIFTPDLSNATQYLPKYTQYPALQQHLAKACAALESAILYIRENNLNTSKSATWTAISAALAPLNLKYIPDNPRVLQRKIQPILNGKTSIADTIQPPRVNNTNASKGFDIEELQSWVFQLRSMGANNTNMFIIRKIEQMCNLVGLEMPSKRYIGKMLEVQKVNFLTAQERFGTSHRAAKVISSYMPFKNALFAGDCWMIDGTRVNFIAHKGVNKKGETVKMFLDVTVVRDVHSGDILGYDFCINENRWSNINALHMAVQKTGYLPFEMVFDKFPGHDAPETKLLFKQFETLGVKVTISTQANTKSNLERWFSTLQTVFMQNSLYYYGEGIRSRRMYNHRSEAFLKKIIAAADKEKFDYHDASQEAQHIIEAYRATAYSKYSHKHRKVEHSPSQLHEISEKPNVRELSADEINFLFGLRKTVSIDGAGLIITEINNVEYLYRCTNADVFSNHRKVEIVYNYEDLSQVDLYAIDTPEALFRKYLGTANYFERIQRFGPDAQLDRIKKLKYDLTAIDNQRKQELENLKTGTYNITNLVVPAQYNKALHNNTESQALTETESVKSNKSVLISGSDHFDDFNLLTQL